MNLTAAANLNSNFSPSNANGRAQFELRVGPFVGNELTVVSFVGSEALNEPFSYEVVFSSHLPEYALHVGTRGLPACLSIYTPAPHEPRVIQGLVVDFGATDTPTNELAAGASRYFVRIAPRLWTLRNNSRRRIFREQTAIEIACAVLKDYDIAPDVQVRKASYPAIPFEYQRKETDLEFIGRVLATAGIFSYFRHASGLLESFAPGAGIAASELSAATSAAAGLGGAIASASGFLSDAESKLGIVTTLVLTDQAASTEQLGDTSIDLAQKGLDKAGGAATASIPGPLGDSVAGVAGVNTGVSDPLVYDTNGQAGYTDAERIFSFSLADPLVPKQVRLRHWNVGDADSFDATAKVAPFSANVTLNAIATVSLAQPASLGLNADGGIRADAPSIAPRAASVFEYGRDGGLQSVPAEREGRAASRALAQARAGTLPGWGTTDCRRLAPGYRFTLQGHPISAFNIEYLVTEVRSQASNPDYATAAAVRDYVCSFRCVPSYIDPLPKKAAPKEHGPEPAVVIGPNSGEIYCDDLNRILVRFRWASGDGFDEDAEGVCRVHLLEVWGGNRYGFQAIPRVGTEVMVNFFEGGEPIAAGQIRSRANKPAFDSPHAASKVGIRSQVLPSGAQSEITIDDHPNRNQILLRSSGDLVTDVTSNTISSHAGDSSESVGGTRRETTGGNATLTFARDLVSDVSGSLRDRAGQDRVTVTDGALTEWVGRGAERTVLGDVETTTFGDHRATYEGASLERHHSHHTVVVAPATGEDRSSACLHVDGNVQGYARRAIEIMAEEGFSLSCGNSHITIRKDSISISSPTITLNGKSISLASTGDARVLGKTASLSGSDSATISGGNTVTVQAQAAAVLLDTNATVQGSKISLGGSNSGSVVQHDSKPVAKTTVRLADTNGNPLPSERAILRKAGDGGVERTVVLDDTGSLTVEGDDALEIRFEDVRLQGDPPPGGAMRPYVVRQGDFLTLLAARLGFDADAVWNHTKNAALRNSGRLPEILHPADVLFVPESKPAWRSLSIGQTNAFVAPVAKVSFSVAFQTSGGEPLASAACVVRGLDKGTPPPPSSTDASGTLAFDVGARQGTFVVEFPDDGYRFVVQLGHMDPLGEESGISKRLQNLGYGMSALLALSFRLGHTRPHGGLRAQITAFQWVNKVGGEGRLDANTIDALKKAHGS